HTKQGNDQLCLVVKFIGTIYLLLRFKIYWYHMLEERKLLASTNVFLGAKITRKMEVGTARFFCCLTSNYE
ncbi:MAG: hypothetical protein ACRC8K_23075, partial [Waterburya sp.]